MKVTGPNGIVINFPDGTPPETIDRVMRDAAGQQEAPRQDSAPVRGRDEPKPSWFGSLMQGIGQGFSLGFGDEIMAGIKTMGGFAGDYGAEVANQRGGLERARTAHPGAYIAGEIGGSIPSALIPLGAAARGASMAGKMIRGAGAGAVQGGVYGAGASDDATRIFDPARLPNAGIGAGAGGLVGGLIPPIARGVGAGVGRMFGGRVPRLSPAQENVSRAFQADDVQPGALTALGDEGMLLDMGPNLQQQAGSVAALPGEGQRILRDAMAARQAGAGQRVRSDMDAALGPEPNVPQTLEQITTRRNAEASRNFPRAYAVPTDITPAIEEALATPAGRTAIMKGQRLAANNGEPFNPKEGLDTRSLHYIGRALGDMIKSARGPEERRALTRVQRLIYDDMDAQNLPFKEARRAYAEPSSVAEALVAGQEVFRRTMSPNELMATLARMTPAEREAFQKGARDQVAEIMGTARNDAGAAFRELAEKGWNREKMSILIGPQEAQRLVTRLERERTFAASNQRVTQNSETARRVAGIGDLTGRRGSATTGALAAGAATGTLTGTAIGAAVGFMRNVAARGIDKALSVSPGEMDEIAREMARMLTARGPERDQAVAALAQLRNRTFNNQATAVRAAALTRKVLGFLNAGTQPALEMSRQ